MEEEGETTSWITDLVLRCQVWTGIVDLGVLNLIVIGVKKVGEIAY